MAVRTVLRMGDSRLLEKARTVDVFDTPELDRLVQDLKDTMYAENGAGLAAPQIGVGLRVVVFGFEENTRYPQAQAIPETILVNPVLEFASETRDDDWEGCLSVPGLRGIVPRYTRIHYSGFNQKGDKVEREAQGFHARVVQHECDHLDGILYPQRMTDMTTLGFTEALVSSGRLPGMPCDTARE